MRVSSRNVVVLSLLLSTSGCATVEWVATRVASVLPQATVVPATSYAVPVPVAQTGATDRVERTSEPAPADANPPPVLEEDWPDLYDCGMG